MTISVDWANKVVESTDSIPDIVAFKDTLRDFEDDDIGMVNDPIITYKRLNLGGGGFFHAVDFINGYELRFPNTGNYSIIGNIGATIQPVAGVFVERTTSSSFASFASGSGVTAQDKVDIAQAVDDILQDDFAGVGTGGSGSGGLTTVQNDKLISLPTREEIYDGIL